MPPIRNRFYFNDGLNVRAYDLRAWQDAERFEDHLPFYVDAAVDSGGPVLELGCGTGRLTLAMAKAGVVAVGLELSSFMLARAMEKCEGVSDEVRSRLEFLAGDMADFQLGRKFALVTIPFRGFQELLTTHDQRSALRCIHDHLAPDGRLVLDLLDPRLEDVLVPEDREPVSLPPLNLGETVLHTTVLDRHNNPLTQVLTEVWRFTEKDRSGRVVREEEEIHSLRWTWRSEMRYLLELTGFAVTAEYSDFHGTPPSPGHQQVWVIHKRTPG
ncbi:MAG: class I SAM-dependent methyltransferase [Alphaproteobacteria bacterium]